MSKVNWEYVIAGVFGTLLAVSIVGVMWALNTACEISIDRQKKYEKSINMTDRADTLQGGVWIDSKCRGFECYDIVVIENDTVAVKN